MNCLARVSFDKVLDRRERDEIADWLERTASILRGTLHPRVVTFEMPYLPDVAAPAQQETHA